MSFPTHSTILQDACTGPNPKRIATLGLASFAFARHYLRNLGFDFSSSWYLDVSVPKVPLIYLCIQYMIYGSSPYVFPHSEICGSIAYLQLTAAYRSLSRLSSAPDAKAFSLCSCLLELLLLRYILIYLGRFVLSSRIAESLLTVFGFFTSRHLVTITCASI